MKRERPTLEIAPNACPYCGYMTDRAMALRGSDAPEDGDLSICGNCAHVAEFMAGATVRLPRERVAKLIRDNQDLAKVLYATYRHLVVNGPPRPELRPAEEPLAASIRLGRGS